MSKVEIDFFELSFLAEACIPPVPIARGQFWQRLIDEIYYDLTNAERAKLFVWMQRNSRFDLNNEDCQLFYARFNPENQYEVQCFHNGKVQMAEAFKRDDKYWTAKNRFINPEYISEVTPKPA